MYIEPVRESDGDWCNAVHKQQAAVPAVVVWVILVNVWASRAKQWHTRTMLIYSDAMAFWRDPHVVSTTILIYGHGVTMSLVDLGGPNMCKITQIRSAWNFTATGDAYDRTRALQMPARFYNDLICLTMFILALALERAPVLFEVFCIVLLSTMYYPLRAGQRTPNKYRTKPKGSDSIECKIVLTISTCKIDAENTPEAF